MITNPSGLQYTDDHVGEGAQAKSGDEVTVHYTGWLFADGERGAKFDSSKDRNDPFEFSLGAGRLTNQGSCPRECPAKKVGRRWVGQACR